ncbi:Voltage-gated Ion Channel (VIC) Superfamily [Achlya hypogyna]|uniref:Voltage-gated Ion Channel (VIC) Superfamily n=1 Tax=Achlya hypogyna TaxID=1202772 RepID=A0A1V9ZH70_ACHHY|nr:Voltage-gated Ion Channel (VIC) Superfamily [Achlya hypogyna]
MKRLLQRIGVEPGPRTHHRASHLSSLMRGESTARVAPDSIGSFQLRRGSLSWEIRHKKTRTIDPDSVHLAAWNILLLFFCLYNALVIPLLLCFDHTICNIPILVGLMYLAEAFFAIDVVVQMHTGFYLLGDMVRNPRLTRRKYFWSWNFPLDILALLPLYALMESPSCGYLYLNKLLRLRRIYAYTLDFDKVFARYFKFCKVVKVVVVSYAFCHISGCIYASFGFDTNEDNIWMLTLHLESEDVVTQYFGALCWAIGIVSKCLEGQIPRTLGQSVFMVVVMVGGFLLFVYICGTLFMLSKCDADTVEKFDAKINQLRYVLSFHRVPLDIQERAVEFLENEFKSGESNDKSNMKLLCPSIAKDVKFTLLKGMVAGVPFFRCCNAAFIRALIDLMETRSLPTNFVVCQKGDQGEDMYFVQAGVLAVSINDVKVRELRKGGFFGELSLFTNQVRTANVATATFCILHMLTRTHVQRVLRAYPEFEEQILQCVSTLLREMDMHNSEVIRRKSIEANDAFQRAKAYGNYVHQIQANTDKRFSRRFVDLLPSPSSGQSQAASTQSKPLSKATNESSRASSTSAFQRPLITQPRWHKLLLRQALDRKARYRLAWVLAVMGVTYYNLFIIPLVNAFIVVGYPPWIQSLNTIADVILWLDIYGKFNLSYVVEAESIFDTVKCAKYYLKTSFRFDALCALPLWILYPPGHKYLRAIRLARALFLSDELEEVALFVRITSKGRIFVLGVMLFFCYHLAGCAAQAYTFIAGYGELHEGWLPPESLELHLNADETAYISGEHETLALDDPHVATIKLLQYCRALYYGAVCLTNLGLPREPETFGEYILACALMLIGMLLISIIIDEVQKRVTASAVEQMEFLSTRSRIQLFLQKQKAPLELHRRVSAFLDFWWSAHRGANINKLVAELPNNIKREILSFICASAVNTLTRMERVGECFPKLCATFLDNLTINLYGQDEMVYRCGDYADSTYVLLEGQVIVYTSDGETNPRGLKSGDFFGLSGLDVDHDNVVHVDQARASTTCVVALVTRQTLLALYEIFPAFAESIVARSSKGHGVLAKQLHVDPVATDGVTKPQPWMLNPDSNFSVLWETLLFFGMVYQCIGVPFYMAFGFENEAVGSSDSFSILLELCFFADIFLKPRTGFLDYGNKVMDYDKVKNRYFRSSNFVIDILAVIPFNLANAWTAKPRSEAWNVNKLLRLFKLSAQIQHLERQYYTINIQIRIFKLVFYIYLLAHFIGCTWYNFASNASTLLGFTTSKQFGSDDWLPGIDMDPANANMTLLMRYTKAHYWGLGLLLGFNPGEYPASSVEYVFTIGVQTLGVFLLAYVVGNLLDIVQILDGNNRAFYSNLNYVRKFIKYFPFSAEMELKIEHFYFYRLFHSIHEEHILAHVLPPSLVADIRLFLLTPMLNKVRFFQDEHPSSNVTRVLVSQMTQVLVTRGELVCRQNEIGVEMYFVFSGCLEVYVMLPGQTPTSLIMDNRSKGLKVNEILAGAFFGEKSLFSDQPRNASIEAKTFCTLYRLSRKHLESVFAQHPEWKAKVMTIVNQMYVEQENKMRQDKAKSMTKPSSFAHTATSPKSQLSLLTPSREDLRKTVSWWRKQAHKLLYVEVQSPVYNTYLTVLCLSLLYIAVSIPYVLTFGNEGLSSGVFVMFMIFNVVTDVVFAYDIWFKKHIVETVSSREFYEETTARRGTQWGDWIDVFTIFPLDYIIGPHYHFSALFRLNRFLKLRQLTHTINEVHRFSMSYEINRLKLLGLYYSMGCYWVACFYFGITFIDGFAHHWNASLPVAYFAIDPNATTEKIFFRLFRCLYFALTLNTGIGIVYEPDDRFLQYNFLFIMSVFGVFVMGYVIGEASTLCIYLIQNEVEFKINQMNVMEFLVRKRITRSIESRVHVFLSYWWSTQSGVMYQSILEQLPPRIRSQANIQIGHLAIARFSARYLRPLCSDPAGIEALVYSMAHRLVFEGYPPGESVIVQGNIGQTMYFVAKGNLISASSATSFVPTRYMDGQFFGEEGFLSASFCTYSVVTLRACDLLALSASDFLAALGESPWFAESAAIAKMVVAALAEPDAYPSLPPSADLGELIYHLIRERSDIQLYCSLTPTECSAAFAPFLVFFEDQSDGVVAKPSPVKRDSIIICQHCEDRAATLYCKFCLQGLCSTCTREIHENTHFAFHMDTIAKLKRPPAKKSLSKAAMTVAVYVRKLQLFSRAVAPGPDEVTSGSVVPDVDDDDDGSHALLRDASIPVMDITHEMLVQTSTKGEESMVQARIIQRANTSLQRFAARKSDTRVAPPPDVSSGPSVLRNTTINALAEAARVSTDRLITKESLASIQDSTETPPSSVEYPPSPSRGPSTKGLLTNVIADGE